MKKFITCAVIASLLFIAGCKKDDKNTSNPSLQNKWGLESTSYNTVEDGVPVGPDNYTGVAADYVDFRKDNKVYSFVDQVYDTSDYQLVGSNKVVIDVDTFQIQTLTESASTLYEKIIFDPQNYEEITIKLKR
jgi:hypothetical protein